MDDKHLLEAMQGMIQENNKALAQMMDERFEAERKHTAQMMDEKLEANKRELKEAINGVDMKLDRHFQKIRNLLKEDYTPVAKAARETKQKISDYDEVKSTQADHANAIQQHNERITALEEKAI